MKRFAFGTSYNDLTIIEDRKECRRLDYILCRCKCGREVDVLLTRLLSGVTKSCGCRLGNNRKLEASDVIEIRHMLKNGDSHKNIANKFGVVKGTITAINTGKSWSDVKV